MRSLIRYTCRLKSLLSTERKPINRKMSALKRPNYSERCFFYCSQSNCVLTQKFASFHKNRDFSVRIEEFFCFQWIVCFFHCARLNHQHREIHCFGSFRHSVEQLRYSYYMYCIIININRRGIVLAVVVGTFMIVQYLHETM